MRWVAPGSSAEHGSSIRSTSGSFASARAMQSRCCWPPDRPVPGVCNRSLTSSHSAAWRSACSTRSGISRFGARPFNRGPYATLSKIVFGNGFGCWNTIPTSRRSATGSVPLENTDTPSRRMSPECRVCGISSFNRFTERRNVLLPQPEGPISAVTARRGIATLTSNSAWVRPYQKL